jgi:hypothetical protein
MATTGWETGGFHGVAGIEFLNQRPLWQYQRKRQVFSWKLTTPAIASDP